MVDKAKVAELVSLLQAADRMNDTDLSSSLDEFSIEEMVAAAAQADVAYEEGEALFSDSVYDVMRERIKLSDTSNEYNLVVGSNVRGGKVALPNGMGSLTQAYATSDFTLWLDKHGLRPASTVWFILTEKLDGMSASIHYGADGKLRIAYSRGNGFEGADITRHVKHIVKLPKRVEPNTEVRAELIISKANFEVARTKVFRSDGSVYKNPRNMISGMMNASSIDPIAYQYIDVIVYHDWNDTELSKEEQLIKFGDMGFRVPRYVKVSGDQLTDEALTRALKKFKDESEFELDGTVVEANEAKVRNKMNPSRATLNPEYARKYKVQDEANNALATVSYVEFRVSKRGYVIPRVHYVPFSLPGITCTHSTGYNMKFIIDNGICPGAKVHMYRAGDVIPNILRGAEKGDWTMADYKEAMDDIGEWEWTENEKGDKVHVKLTGDHADVGLKLTEAFFTGIGVDGLKLGNLRKLFSVGFNTPEKIIHATAEELGFALASQSTADKIHVSLHKALKNVTLPQFMGASGMFGRGVGKRKVQALYDQLGDKLLELSVEQGLRVIPTLDGFADKTASKVMNGIGGYKDFFESVKDAVEFVQPKVVEGGKLNGQKFLFTGFRSKELQVKIEAAGGEVMDSFSSKITCVIAGDPEENTGKVAKARAKGTKIIGLADVNDLFE